MKKNDNSGKDNVEHYMRTRICACHGNITVKQLAQETGYSACYIRKIFKQDNGISPKQFEKNVRFRYLLQIIAETDGDYAAAAARCGYYDEAHMIRDFKSYTGTTPEKYNKRTIRPGGCV